MTYQQVSPHPALANLVEFFGIQQSNELSDAVTQVLPTTHHDLLIHFGDPFLHHIGEFRKQEPIAYLCGQRTEPYNVSATGATGILVCSFYPWAVAELTGTSLSCCINQSIDAIDVFPNIRTSLNQIQACKNSHARIRLLEKYLLSLLKPENGFVRHVSNVILKDPQEAITNVANGLGLSKRQLDRRFIDAVGLSPKMFSRVIKFQKALSFRQSGTPAAIVAASCGYYDQAHMHRELKALGGHTPGKLFEKTDATPLLSQFNVRSTQLSRFYNTLYLV